MAISYFVLPLSASFIAAAEHIARFGELAREYGFAVTLEPLAGFATARLEQARDIIRASGVDAGIVLDVLHLVRERGTAADVRALEPGLIRSIQLNLAWLRAFFVITSFRA